MSIANITSESMALYAPSMSLSNQMAFLSQEGINSTYFNPNERLYVDMNGTISLKEKPIGIVIGEQILSPAIDIVISFGKSFFGFVEKGFEYIDQILTFPGIQVVGAQRGRRRSVNNHRRQVLSDYQQRRREAGVSARGGSLNSLSPNEISLESLSDPIKILQQSLLGELAKVLPKSATKTLEETKGNNWIDVILDGVKNVFIDLTQFLEPVHRAEELFLTWEIIYWMQSVKPEYVKIFPEPLTLHVEEMKGALDKVEQMRKKLKQHGYKPLVYGTPLQFLKFLQQEGKCEGGECRHDEF